MASAYFKEVFSDCIPENCLAFENAELVFCNVSEQGEMQAQVYCDTYIKTAELLSVRDKIVKQFGLISADISARFSPEDCEKLKEMLHVIGEELMPEIDIPAVNANQES